MADKVYATVEAKFAVTSRSYKSHNAQNFLQTEKSFRIDRNWMVKLTDYGKFFCVLKTVN